MTELLGNAWTGWHSFTAAGKLAALLLISLLFLWIYYKKVVQKPFLVYTTVAVACCIVPVTAAVLMLYQTGFYDYEWIWSIVPLTAMIGFAATVFITDVLKSVTEGDRKKEAAVILMMLATLILCSGMGTGDFEFAENQSELKRAEELLEELGERMEGREIYLWAPREITEYARECNAGIRVLYGRNMWDISLDAYAYDTYSREMADLDCWMRNDEEKETLSDGECAEIVASTEVNCILLPGGKSNETIECFEEKLGTRAEFLGDYYLLIR